MKVAILGSINMDIVYQVDTPPSKGQTVFGSTYDVLPGGKGANQGVILQALGVDVSFLGAIGPDGFGQMAVEAFQDKSLPVNYLVHSEKPTGIAIIELSQNDNSIVVIPGANQAITREDVKHFFDHHPTLDVVVAQLETNMDSVKYFLQMAHERHIPTILNPAPAHPIGPEWMEFVDIMIPNEHEAAVIFGDQSLETLVSMYPNRLIVTLGELGAMYHNGSKVVHLPSYPVNVVDTTGAGDSFVAGFTAAYLSSQDIELAIHEGMKTASITCEHLGAQGAYHVIKEKNR